jgi:hypothetical protein
MYDTSQQLVLSAAGGATGILFSGAMVFSPYAGADFGEALTYSESAIYHEGGTFDACGCHASDCE